MPPTSYEETSKRHSKAHDKKGSKATKSIKKPTSGSRTKSGKLNNNNNNNDEEKKRKTPKKRVYNFQNPVKKLFRSSLKKELKNKKITFSDEGIEGKFNQIAESFLSELCENIRTSYPSTSFSGKRKVIKVGDINMVLKVGKHFKNNYSELLEGGNLAVKEWREEELRKEEEGEEGGSRRGKAVPKNNSKSKSKSDNGSSRKKKKVEKENEVVMKDVESDDEEEGVNANTNSNSNVNDNGNGTQESNTSSEDNEEEVQQAQQPLEEEMSDVEQSQTQTQSQNQGNTQEDEDDDE